MSMTRRYGSRTKELFGRSIDQLDKKVESGSKGIQIMTGVAEANFPTSSSSCIIFLIRACDDPHQFLVLHGTSISLWRRGGVMKPG
jgi:hypothetical protein